MFGPGLVCDRFQFIQPLPDFVGHRALGASHVVVDQRDEGAQLWMSVLEPALLPDAVSKAEFLSRMAAVSRLRHPSLVRTAVVERDEERIYDVLEQSVAGDLLTEIYLETRRGLEIQNQGGARAKVKELDLVELETESGANGGFQARAIWDVSGSVGHWGHLHRRTNRYRAGLEIEPVEGQWKLTSLDLLEEERLPSSQAASGAGG